MFNAKKKRIKELEKEVGFKRSELNTLQYIYDTETANWARKYRDLEQEFADLSYRHGVLGQVLKQLNINVTLPKRKADK